MWGINSKTVLYDGMKKLIAYMNTTDIFLTIILSEDLKKIVHSTTIIIMEKILLVKFLYV